MRNLTKVLREAEKKVTSVIGLVEDVKALRIWKGKRVIPNSQIRTESSRAKLELFKFR